MPDFGLIAIPTHYTIQPVELGRWAEANGFESLWFGEHSHIPTSRKTPFPMGGELPQYYKEFFDPFIGLTAAAAVTKKLKVGTSVCLVPEHNTMNLAKIVSCLDRVSNGRFLFGMGGDEMAEGSFVRRPDTPNAARAIQKIIEFVHEHAHQTGKHCLPDAVSRWARRVAIASAY